MSADLEIYYHDHVLTPYVEYETTSKGRCYGQRKDLRKAIEAASALFHFREHLPAPLARIFHTRNRFSIFRGSECGKRRGRHACFHKSLGFEAPARFAGPKPRLGDMAVDASPLRRAWLDVFCGQAGSSVRLTVR